MSNLVVNTPLSVFFVDESKYDITITKKKELNKPRLSMEEYTKLYNEAFSNGINDIDEYYESDFYKKYVKKSH